MEKRFHRELDVTRRRKRRRHDRPLMLSRTNHSPGWKTSYLSLVTTVETNSGSALAKKGTAATRERQLKFITSWREIEREGNYKMIFAKLFS